MIQHRINTRTVRLHGYDFKLFDITFYAGTDREKSVTAAEATLEDFICNIIDDEEYDDETLAVDSQYGYYVPEMVEDEREIVESIRDAVYLDDQDPLYEPDFEVIHTY